MEGYLMKKTKNGAWHSRQFKLNRANLTWLKSDNKTYITVDVSQNATLRDIKIGPKKFAFDLIFAGAGKNGADDIISLSASGEAEKAAWMSALSAAMGKKEEGATIFNNSVANRKSIRKSMTNNTKTLKLPTAAAAAALIPPIAEAGGNGGGNSSSNLSLSNPAANANLAKKIGGRVMVTNQTICAVCKLAVYKIEELIVDKATMHKRCFQCNHCKRQLTMGNFACINSTFYCKVHYFELFSQSGGKYEKAFGDAGFAHKAQTSYTPPPSSSSTAKPGTVPVAAAKSVETSSPPVPVVVAETTPVVVAAAAAAPPPAVVKQQLRMESPPVEPKAKPKLEVLPKKNMDLLRKNIILPGQAPPPKATPKPVAAAPSVEIDAAVGVKEEKNVPPVMEIRPSPIGINFALEAVKKRQAQLGMTIDEPPILNPVVFGDGSANRQSVRTSTRLDHSAVLSKPKMGGGRRAPKVQQVGKLLPKIELDKMGHDFTFKILLAGMPSTSEETLVVHATSQFERDHWVSTLNANIYLLTLENELVQAQKRDMMSALQAIANIDAFVEDNETTYSGFLEKLSMKSQRNWKKRWFTLGKKGEFSYFENENAKKAKQVLHLTYLTVLTSATGERLDAPLVIKTAQVATEATNNTNPTGGSEDLPMNFAIFDNQEATVDLSAVFNETGVQVAIPEETVELQQEKEDEEAAAAGVEASPKEENTDRKSTRNLLDRVMSLRLQQPLQPNSPVRLSSRDLVQVEERHKSVDLQKPTPSPLGKKSVAMEELTTEELALEVQVTQTPPSAAQEEVLNPDVVVDPSMNKQEEDEIKINTAWARPGSVPVRVGGSTPNIEPPPPPRSGPPPRSKVKKNCAIM